MDKALKKGRIVETLKREEVKNIINYASGIDELNHICDVFLEDIEKDEFEELLAEILQDGNINLNEDLQDISAGLKVGSLYFET